MKGEIYNFILHSDVGTGTSVASKPILLIGIEYQTLDTN